MLNSITIMGRLTKDIELRYTQNQKAVASFAVACDRDRTSNGEKQTDFIDCVAWDRTAEFLSKFFRKGSMIVVDGRLQQRLLEDSDGNKKSVHEINVEHIYFGEAKRND